MLQAGPPPSDYDTMEPGGDPHGSVERHLQHPDRNRPCEGDPYASIPIKPNLMAMATALTRFAAPSLA